MLFVGVDDSVGVLFLLFLRLSIKSSMKSKDFLVIWLLVTLIDVNYPPLVILTPLTLTLTL